MPVTKGQGNPDWTREETLLALELLYGHGKPLYKSDTEAMKLSRELRAARIHDEGSRRANFRNPDGVALKLQNLWAALNPDRALSASKTDRQVVTEFPESRHDDLKRLCATIRLSMNRDAAPEEPDPEEVFVEGRHATVRHRKRDDRLRQRLLAARRTAGLKCEICDFSPTTFDSDLRASFFEAHHDKPLADAEGERATRVTDMSLLCARCHRFIHKLIATNRRWVGVPEARDTYALGLRPKKP